MIRDLNQSAQQPTQPQITETMVENADTIACIHCGGYFITTVVEYKLISKIVLGTPQPAIVPIPIHRCSDCGEVFDMEEAIKNLQESK